MSWSSFVKQLIEEGYDFEINYEEKYFLCPEYWEIIYWCDYPIILDGICPVCEENLF